MEKCFGSIKMIVVLYFVTADEKSIYFVTEGFFEVNPDTVCDFRKLPFPDKSFFLICFDPPHLLQAGETSWIKKKYGSLNRLTWSEDLSKGFDECWRVLKPGGTLIFKWNETQISLREVLSCFSRRPVFGHTTTKRRDTHWMTFYKDAALKAVEEGK